MSSLFSRRVRLPGALMLALLVLAKCGGKDDDPIGPVDPRKKGRFFVPDDPRVMVGLLALVAITAAVVIIHRRYPQAFTAMTDYAQHTAQRALAAGKSFRQTVGRRRARLFALATPVFAFALTGCDDSKLYRKYPPGSYDAYDPFTAQPVAIILLMGGAAAAIAIAIAIGGKGGGQDPAKPGRGKSPERKGGIFRRPPRFVGQLGPASA